MAEVMSAQESSSDVVPPKTDCRRQCQDAAKKYLQEKKIQDLIRFMIGHLLVSKPDHPVDFLSDLLRRCLDFRSAQTLNAPLLFADRHLEAVFNMMDPFGQGSIPLRQYHTGMSTMGITDFKREPTTDKDGNVSKDTFVREARTAMEHLLLTFLKV